ncbi:MAG: arylesterase [Mesorhizobium amorphae]|nr:MAG: arylesterase [Mesorhizobium amorphae]
MALERPNLRKSAAAAIFLVTSFCVALTPAWAEPSRVVGFGDSLMAGYGLPAGQGFTDQLQAALRAKGHEVEVANAGVSGDTTSGGLARLDWSVPDNTDLVILELGANDMLRGLPPEAAEKNLDAMLARLQARNIPVLLAGMRAAPNLGPDYVARFEGMYPRLAEKYGVPLYPFFLDGIEPGSNMFLEDRMHPNREGIARMVERALPAVEALLPKPGAS